MTNKKIKNPPVWVTPHKDGWAVKKEGSKRPTKVTATKQEAVNIGHDIAKKDQTEFIVQKKDGQIQSKDSFGNDPCPPKDTEH
jgi:hypothetical protein